MQKQNIAYSMSCYELSGLLLISHVPIEPFRHLQTSMSHLWFMIFDSPRARLYHVIDPIPFPQTNVHQKILQPLCTTVKITISITI